VNQLGGIAVVAPQDQPCRQTRLDEQLYQERHRIKDLFYRLKSYRRIATRYEKLHGIFAAMVARSCLLIWLKYWANLFHKHGLAVALLWERDDGEQAAAIRLSQGR
jgi:hypothetical protein